MPIFFGHRTAELLLEKPEIGLLSPSVDQELEHCWTNKVDFANADLSLLEGIPQPYHVLVSSPAELRSWDMVQCHLCQAHLPAGAFIEIAPDVFVASPSLCLIQRAENLTLSQTVALGERYCGFYALDSRCRSGIRRRNPLVSLDDLRGFIAHCGRVRGIARARHAVSLMLEGAASPMESISRMVYCFPRRLGGFGLALPCMNYEKTLSQMAQRLVDKRYVVIDLYWKNYDFGVEYQESMHIAHTAAWRPTSHDSLRRSVWESSCR